MATIYREYPIDSTVDAAWAKLADVGNVHQMLSILTDTTIDGDKRMCAMVGGGRIEELILSIDDDRHRVAYSVLSAPGVDLEFHAASMSLQADGDAARFIWTTDLKPDEAADQIAGLIDNERDNIRAFFAGGVASTSMTAEAEFGGLCATSLALSGTEFPGDPAIRSTHDGKTYFFGSPQAKEMFDADPDGMLAKIDR